MAKGRVLKSPNTILIVFLSIFSCIHFCFMDLDGLEQRSFMAGWKESVTTSVMKDPSRTWSAEEGGDYESSKQRSYTFTTSFLSMNIKMPFDENHYQNPYHILIIKFNSTQMKHWLRSKWGRWKKTHGTLF